VRLTESGTPVTPSDGNNGQFGKNYGASDGGSDFLCTLDTKTDMAIKVTNGNKGLETGTLTSTRLLLHGHDLHDLVLEPRDESLDDLVLLDGERVEVDLLDLVEPALLDEAAELGDGDPLLFLLTRTTTPAAAPATVAAPAAPEATAEPAALAATLAAALRHGRVREGWLGCSGE